MRREAPYTPTNVNVRCRQCNRQLEEGEVVYDLEDKRLCRSCILEERQKSYPLAKIGEADPAALEWINSVWHLIPDDTELARYGKPPIRLKVWIRDNADAIRIQKPLRDRALEEVEKATGVRRLQEALR
jgi:hypothetical protein